MNIIADRLFALLLGWTRSLFNGAWNLVTNNSAGLAGFLQRFWLPVIVLLLVFGTLVDYVIWLIRWRPYYVWSAWLRKRLSQKRLGRTQNYMEDLDHSPLDLPEYQEMDYTQPQLLDEPVYFDFHTPWQEQAPETEAMFDSPAPAQDDPPPLFVPSLPWENLRPVPLMPLNQVDSLPDDPLEQDIGQWPPRDVDPGYAQRAERWQEPPAVFNTDETPTTVSQRRRRVDTKRRGSPNVLRSLRETFFVSDDDLEPLDSIQPPITQEDAFHKPYYPQNYTYREQGQAPKQQDTGPQ